MIGVAELAPRKEGERAVVFALQGAGGGKVAFGVGVGGRAVLVRQAEGRVVAVAVVGYAKLSQPLGAGGGGHLVKAALPVGGKGRMCVHVGEYHGYIVQPTPRFVNHRKRRGGRPFGRPQKTGERPEPALLYSKVAADRHQPQFISWKVPITVNSSDELGLTKESSPSTYSSKPVESEP